MVFQGRGVTDGSAPLRAQLRRTGLILLGVVSGPYRGLRALRQQPEFQTCPTEARAQNTCDTDHRC